MKIRERSKFRFYQNRGKTIKIKEGNTFVFNQGENIYKNQTEIQLKLLNNRHWFWIIHPQSIHTHSKKPRHLINFQFPPAPSSNKNQESIEIESSYKTLAYLTRLFYIFSSHLASKICVKNFFKEEVNKKVTSHDFFFSSFLLDRRSKSSCLKTIGLDDRFIHGKLRNTRCFLQNRIRKKQ
jgi:hypothetical protein